MLLLTRTLSAAFLILLLSVGTAAASQQTAPRVLLQTTHGDIEIELYPDLAPLTVDNFLRYVDDGFYNGTVFHRVINSFMIQGGGYTADLEKKNTREAIINEADNGLKNERGTLAMARTADPNSATSQFFINHVDNDFLNHKERSPRGWGYCVFARVTKGMQTVDAIADEFTHTRNNMQNVPEQPVIIEQASRL